MELAESTKKATLFPAWGRKEASREPFPELTEQVLSKVIPEGNKQGEQMPSKW